MKTFDSNQDSFRIRLICTVLDTLGKYFQRGERKKIMDRFLMYFQRYIFSKSYVLMDLEFMILDTFDTLRSSLIRFQSLEEADEVCNKLEDRDVKGQDFTDILALYMKDGGGYNVDHQQYYYDELQHYYDEEYYHPHHAEKPSAAKDNKHYQEEDYYGEEGGAYG